MDGGQLAQDKKKAIELTKYQKSRFDLDKKKLHRQIIVYLKDVLSSRKMVEYWKRQFLLLIAFYSIMTQIHKQFQYLVSIRDQNRRRLVATLFAVSKVKYSLESRGESTVDRSRTEVKM